MGPYAHCLRLIHVHVLKIYIRIVYWFDLRLLSVKKCRSIKSTNPNWSANRMYEPGCRSRICLWLFLTYLEVISADFLRAAGIRTQNADVELSVDFSVENWVHYQVEFILKFNKWSHEHHKTWWPSCASNRIIAHLMLNATGSLTQGCCPNTDINSKRLHPRLALEWRLEYVGYVINKFLAIVLATVPIALSQFSILIVLEC